MARVASSGSGRRSWILRFCGVLAVGGLLFWIASGRDRAAPPPDLRGELDAARRARDEAEALLKAARAELTRLQEELSSARAKASSPGAASTDGNPGPGTPPEAPAREEELEERPEADLALLDMPLEEIRAEIDLRRQERWRIPLISRLSGQPPHEWDEESLLSSLEERHGRSLTDDERRRALRSIHAYQALFAAATALHDLALQQATIAQIESGDPEADAALAENVRAGRDEVISAAQVEDRTILFTRSSAPELHRKSQLRELVPSLLLSRLEEIIIE